MVEMRGRKTALDYITAVIPGGGRPAAPNDLPEDEAAVWRQVVDAMPDGWFGGQTRDILRLYCFQVSVAELLAREARCLKAAPMTERSRRQLSGLSADGGRVAKIVSNLASVLRLTPQARVRKVIAEAAIRNAPKGPRPWED